MDDQTMSDIKERAKQASDGPWFHDDDDEITQEDGTVICRITNHGSIATIHRYHEEYSHCDADFIAESRRDILLLIEEIERLKSGT